MYHNLDIAVAAVSAGLSAVGGASKQTRDSDGAAMEASLGQLHQIKLVPDIFRLELYLRLGKQAAELGQSNLAVGCARKAKAYLRTIEGLFDIAPTETKNWIFLAHILSIQLDSTGSIQPIKGHAQAFEENISSILMVFQKCLVVTLKNSLAMGLYLRVLWGLLKPSLTKQRRSIIYRSLVAILKKINHEYSKTPDFRSSVDALNDSDFEVLQRLFAIVIDISIDENHLHEALRLADWGMRLSVGKKQSDIWFRKAHVLNLVGKGSALVPPKDKNLEAQSLAWYELSKVLHLPDKKKDVLLAGLKFLASKRLENTWVHEQMQLEYRYWQIITGLGSQVQPLESFHFLQQAGQASTDDKRLERLIAFLRERITLAQQAIGKDARRVAIQPARHAIEALAASMFLPPRQPPESEKEAFSSKETAVKSRKSKETSPPDVPEVPSADKWHAFVWPESIRNQYIDGTTSGFVSKKALKFPLQFCSALLETARELVLADDMQATHPTLCLLELVAELSLEQIPEMHSAAILYFAVVLSLQGSEQAAREKHRTALLQAITHRSEHDLSPALKTFEQPGKRSLLCSHADVLVLKAECHLFFADYLDCHGALTQAIRHGRLVGDVRALANAYSLGALLGIATERYEQSAYFSSRAFNAFTILPRPDINLTLALTLLSAAVSVIRLPIDVSGQTPLQKSLSYLGNLVDNSRSDPLYSRSWGREMMLAKLWVIAQIRTDMDAAVTHDDDRILYELEAILELVIAEPIDIVAQDTESHNKLQFILEVYNRYFEILSIFDMSTPRVRTLVINASNAAGAVISTLEDSPFVKEKRQWITKILFYIADARIHDFFHPIPIPKRTIMDVLDEFLKKEMEKRQKEQDGGEVSSELANDSNPEASSAIHLDFDVFHYIEKMLLPSGSDCNIDYYLGMDAYMQMQKLNRQQDLQKQSYITLTKRLMDSIDGLIKQSDFGKAKIASEVLFDSTIKAGSESSQVFKYLAALHTSEGLPFIHRINRRLFGRIHSCPDFGFPGLSIPEIHISFHLQNRANVPNDALACCFPSPMCPIEWPNENIKLVLMQHSKDGAILNIAVVDRRRQTSQPAKGDRKKAPSDDFMMEYQTRQIERSPLKDLARKYYKNAVDGKALDEIIVSIEAALDEAFSSFRTTNGAEETQPNATVLDLSRSRNGNKDKDKEDNTSTATMASVALNSSTTAAPQATSAVEDGYQIILLLDAHLEVLPLEGILLKYFEKATCVSRDLNFQTMTYRFSQREDILAKASVQEPTSKKKDKAVDQEKEKPSNAAINYLFAPSVIQHGNAFLDDLSKIATKISGQVASDFSLEELSDTLQRAPISVYCGPSIMSQKSLYLIPEIKMNGISVIVCDFFAGVCLPKYMPNIRAKEIATIFTLQGALSVAVPYRILTSREAAQSAIDYLRSDVNKGIGAWLLAESDTRRNGTNRSSAISGAKLCLYGLNFPCQISVQTKHT